MQHSLDEHWQIEKELIEALESRKKGASALDKPMHLISDEWNKHMAEVRNVTHVSCCWC
jgi:hypothetical protein